MIYWTLLLSVSAGVLQPPGDSPEEAEVWRREELIPALIEKAWTPFERMPTDIEMLREYYVKPRPEAEIIEEFNRQFENVPAVSPGESPSRLQRLKADPELRALQLQAILDSQKTDFVRTRFRSTAKRERTDRSWGESLDDVDAKDFTSSMMMELIENGDYRMAEVDRRFKSARSAIRGKPEYAWEYRWQMGELPVEVVLAIRGATCVPTEEPVLDASRSEVEVNRLIAGESKVLTVRVPEDSPFTIEIASGSWLNGSIMEVDVFEAKPLRVKAVRFRDTFGNLLQEFLHEWDAGSLHPRLWQRSWFSDTGELLKRDRTFIVSLNRSADLTAEDFDLRPPEGFTYEEVRDEVSRMYLPDGSLLSESASPDAHPERNSWTDWRMLLFAANALIATLALIFKKRRNRNNAAGGQ